MNHAGVGREVNHRDERIKAGLAWSPAPVADPRRYATAYRDVRIPILHMTGTEDTSVIGESNPAHRRIPYDRITAPGQYLVIFEGGDHMVFSGVRLRGPPVETDARFHDLIRQSAVAFFDAWLLANDAARTWLDEASGLATELGHDGTFERK